MVTKVDVQKIDAKKSKIVFWVDEGKRFLVEEVSLDGMPQELPKESPDIRAFLAQVATGKPFDYDQYTEVKTKILATLLAHGYAYAQVEGRAEVDRRKQRVRLRYAATPGPQVRFGSISVRGLEILPESAVTNRLTFARGELFHPKKIVSSQTNVRGLGRFGVVRIDFVDQEANRKGDVAVTVTETPRQEVRLGGGVGIDRDNFSVRGRAGYTLHGVIDPLLTFAAELRPAYVIVRADRSQRQLIGEAQTSLTREDLFWPLTRGRAALAYDIDVLEAYSSRGGNVFLGLSRPLWRKRIHLGIGWRFELIDFTRVEEVIDMSLRQSLGLESPYRVGLFEQSVALDLRDNPINAQSGFYAQLKLEEGGSFAGGTFAYGRVTPEVRGYYPFSSRVGIAARAKLGWSLWGDLPITRRYFSGGATRHRGFSQRRLSPVAGAVETSDIGIGGDKLGELMLETRVGIVKLAGEWLGITLFGDGGDVVVGNDSLDPMNLHWAFGAGVRYHTIVGPIRFDVGYRVNRAGAGQIQSGDRFAFHFSIGEAF